MKQHDQCPLFLDFPEMFSQGSLLLIVAVGLVTSVSQPIKWAKSLIFPEVPILNPLPKVVQDISNVPGVTLQKNGLTGLPETPGLNPLPIINTKDTLPLPKEDLAVNAATVGDKPILPEIGVPGAPTIPGLYPLPVNNAQDTLPLPDPLTVNSATIGDKPILPELGVPASPAVPGLNPLPVSTAKDSLPLPKGDLCANSASVENKPILPKLPGATDILGLNTLPKIIANLPIPKEDSVINAVSGIKPNLPKLDVPGLPTIPGPNPLPLINIKDSLPLPTVDVSVKTATFGDKPILPNLGIPGATDIPGLNLLPNINAKDNLPIPKEDSVVNAVTGDKPNLTKVPGISAAADMSSQWQDLNHRVQRLESVLKLEGRIQVVGNKMMATSGKEVDYATSKSICNAVNGQIATPKSEAENTAVLAFAKKYNRYTYLGMREGPIPGVFRYQNGVPAIYTRWRKGEPNGKGKENCVHMYTDGQWNDKACNQKGLTVCEL